jgi:hypothetical protein
MRFALVVVAVLPFVPSPTRADACLVLEASRRKIFQYCDLAAATADPRKHLPQNLALSSDF